MHQAGGKIDQVGEVQQRLTIITELHSENAEIKHESCRRCWRTQRPWAFLLVYCLKPFLSTSWSLQNAHKYIHWLNFISIISSKTCQPYHRLEPSPHLLMRLNWHTTDVFRPAGGGHHYAVIHVAKVSLTLLFLLLSIERLYSFLCQKKKLKFPISCFGSRSVPCDIQHKKLHISWTGCNRPTTSFMVKVT